MTKFQKQECRQVKKDDFLNSRERYPAAAVTVMGDGLKSLQKYTPTM